MQTLRLFSATGWSARKRSFPTRVTSAPSCTISVRSVDQSGSRWGCDPSGTRLSSLSVEAIWTRVEVGAQRKTHAREQGPVRLAPIPVRLHERAHIGVDDDELAPRAARSPPARGPSTPRELLREGAGRAPGEEVRRGAVDQLVIGTSRLSDDGPPVQHRVPRVDPAREEAGGGGRSRAELVRLGLDVDVGETRAPSAVDLLGALRLGQRDEARRARR